MTASSYQLLETRFARIAAIHDACGILSWDYQTMMPTGSAPGRGEQMATLNVLAHELLTAGEVADWLAAAADRQTDLNDWQRANLREMKRRYAHAAAVPADLVEAMTKATAACEMTWRTARPAADFPMLLPQLGEVLALVRQVAAAKAQAFGLSPYDALLDEYDPGNRAARIDLIFDEMAEFLPDLISRAIEHQSRQPEPVRPQGPFATEAQRRLGQSLMERVGFDFGRGRLDVSAHPFCGGAKGDNRITTRYDEADFMKALMGVLHETGHAMYEQGLPSDYTHQPVGDSRGMTAHESQSLIVEMQAARTPEFLGWLAPQAAAAFGRQGSDDGAAWTGDNFRRLNCRVSRSFIRVDADEVTYPAHVILRYRLERAMIADDLALADLPGAWNDGMQSLLGVTPPDDRLGCLQDIHWPGGAFGYFPTYTLGAMTAAQLFDAATRADPAIRPGLATGDFAPLQRWLRANVHGQGCLPESAEDLLSHATGRPLDVDVFKGHLEARYLAA